MELLNTPELNSIISSVDKETSLFQNCNVFDKDVTESFLMNPEYILKSGMSSVSLTDFVKSELSGSGSRPKANVFLKMWIDWNDIVNEDLKNGTHQVLDGINALKITGDIIKVAGTQNPRQFYFEISDLGRTGSLVYEAKVYEYITKNIILRNISPNFIPLLLNKKCPIATIIKSLNAEPSLGLGKKNLLDKLTTLHSVFPNLTMSFIMTGSSDLVTSLADFLKDKFKPDYECLSVIFQYMYALYILDKYKIQHNDNHFSNSLVQTLPTPINLNIKIGENEVTFSTRYIVKFFDWDRAYAENLGDNSELFDYYYVRQLNTFVPNRDFSQFLCQMESYFKYTNTYSVLKTKILDSFPEATDKFDEVVIPGGITPALLQWISANPKNIILQIKHPVGNYYVAKIIAPCFRFRENPDPAAKGE